MRALFATLPGPTSSLARAAVHELARPTRPVAGSNGFVRSSPLPLPGWWQYSQLPEKMGATCWLNFTLVGAACRSAAGPLDALPHAIRQPSAHAHDPIRKMPIIAVSTRPV